VVGLDVGLGGGTWWWDLMWDLVVGLGCGTYVGLTWDLVVGLSTLKKYFFK
jgi:hypothetical protein